MGNLLGPDEALERALDIEKNKTLIFIEGNISSGKSTLVNELRSRGFPVWQEAVDRLTGEYRDAEKRNILDLFYSDMKAYSFKMQIVSLTMRWKIIKECLDYLHSLDAKRKSILDDFEIVELKVRPTDVEVESVDSELKKGIENAESLRTRPSIQSKIRERVTFIERSILTDFYTFAVELYESGFIDELEWKIYINLLKEHIKDAVPHFGDVNIAFIYLKTDPEECMRRKSERNRAEESGVTLGYLKSLDSRLNNWLLKEKPGVRKIVIDGHQSKEQVVNDVIEMIGGFHLMPVEKKGVDLLNLEIQDFPTFN